jgi:hypothetical protein
MLLVGCLLAFGAATVPRVVLILAWIFSPRWDLVFDTWIWPVLGIIFAPYTTIMFLLIGGLASISGFGWIWIALGVVLDVMKWSQIINNRRGIPGYPREEPEPVQPSQTISYR